MYTPLSVSAFHLTTIPSPPFLTQTYYPFSFTTTALLGLRLQLLLLYKAELALLQSSTVTVVIIAVSYAHTHIHTHRASTMDTTSPSAGFPGPSTHIEAPEYIGHAYRGDSDWSIEWNSMYKHSQTHQGFADPTLPGLCSFTWHVCTQVPRLSLSLSIRNTWKIDDRWATHTDAVRDRQCSGCVGHHYMSEVWFHSQQREEHCYTVDTELALSIWWGYTIDAESCTQLSFVPDNKRQQ